ncbi:MAG: hypothetical protein LBH46_04445 [Rickettsiales bacterium]|nr:hypothetical protein [Rickettsiales bacterium]
MKKILLLIFALCISVAEAKLTLENKKILTVYYSLTGSTKSGAITVQKEVGGDIFELIQETPYPANYQEAVRVSRNDVETDFKPTLKGNPKNIAQYDIIFLGSPIWFGQVAPAVKTFLSENDLSGKTIIPFVSHGGGGKSKSEDIIKRLAPKSNVLSVKQFRGKATENEIKEWIKDYK